MRYTDPSTNEVYADFVPDEIDSADAAMAWKFYLTEEEYDGLSVEGLHENYVLCYDLLEKTKRADQKEKESKNGLCKTRNVVEVIYCLAQRFH